MIFKTFNSQQYIENHSLEEKGQSDGGFNIPKAGSQDPSPTEAQIKVSFTSFYGDELEKSRKTTDRLEEDIVKYRDLIKANGHRGQIAKLTVSLNNIYSSLKQRINQKHQKYKAEYNSYNQFRMVHELARPCDLKSNTYKAWSLFLVFVMFVVETTFNTGLLSDAIPGGILGALSVAGIVSVINIVVSFLVGRLALTYFINVKRNIRRKIFSIFVLITYICLIFYFNFAMGVFRSLAEKAMTLLDSTAITNATKLAVWPFDDFSELTFASTGLIVIGLMFAIISLLDGYFYDDSYPGYAKAAKRANKAKQELNDEVLLSHDKLHGESKRGINKIQDLKEKRLEACTNLAHAYDDVQQLFSGYQDWTKGLEISANALVSLYRAKNRQFRTDPEPNSFSENLDLEISKDPNKVFPQLSQEHIDDDVKDESTLVAQETVTEEYNQATVELSDLYNSKLKEFEQFEESLDVPQL